MTVRKSSIPALALAFPALAMGANPVVGPEVTIYNGDLALVKDHRQIDLAKGRQEYAWEGVAQTLDATSASFGSPGAWVLEQNYRFDLVSRSVLLSKFLGREVQLVQETVSADGRTTTSTTTGRILSIEGERISSLESNGKILLDPPGRVVLPSLPEGLLVKPSLVLDVESPKGGKVDAELRYLCRGFSWKADYVAVLDAAGKGLDLEGLVTLQNRSGATFRDARLKLVAGDVNLVQEFPRYLPPPPSAPLEKIAEKAMAAPAQFKEEGLFEYHLYDLQRPTTLLDKEQKQVNLLAAQGIQATTRYVFDETLHQRYWWWPREDDSQDGLKCAVVVDVANREDNHLGMPLPKGKVRVYKADKAGSLEFVGEDRIDHTPSGETLHLALGQAFELRGKRVVQSSSEKNNHKTETVKINLRNSKDEDVVVEVVEHQSYPTWKVESASQAWESRDASTIAFKVKVPRRGKTEVTYTYSASWR